MTTYIATDTQFDFAPRPGRLLQRELDARAISQAQLAARTGLSTKHINLVIKGTAPLSPDVAVTLEQILGTSAETWLHLEAAHQAHEARIERRNALAGFVDWASTFPRQLLIDRKVIDRADSGPDLAAKLLAFFSVASPNAFAKTWLEPQASYKRSQIHSIDPNLTALWLRLSELHAGDLIAEAPTYDSAKLQAAAALLPKLTVHDDVGRAFTKAQELLLGAGVVLVFVPEIPNTRISGVSRWINGTPMIAVTSRYKALDSLWFTLLHEIAHVLLHPKRSTFIDVDGFKADDDADAQETAANAFAQDHLIPPAYRAQLAATTTVKGIVSLANVLGVSPSLVAGQWAFRTKTWGGPIAKLRKKFDLADLLA
ncbi:ImmA/IrrE family metallo-endopeptidase [Pseudarthrobacter sp. ATCC 49987]|uniref:ImmA/IrrE family metallo-endopeptidase n=1 Tax=Pseudarthrobacter sp. ATCC 49987 TaxID=2698204 RepID=UPI001369F926|nr:ImmA/IrrE family metallo-endopeptidase [Pseudarthrobacter sp. ATCC 49987]